MTLTEPSTTDDTAGRERAFAIDDVFFSTTDRRGVIRSGNDVFIRVSGYDVDELVGRPHNVIRHPDTPRSVFRLLWSYLDAGRPIAAYVKNRAKDGSYYWVLAAARPVGDTLVSVRLKPTSALFDNIRRIYTEMRDSERRVEHDAGSHRDAMDASVAVLTTRLTELGFYDYDTFMRTALATEVDARRAIVNAASGGTPTRHRHDGATLGNRLDAQLTSVDRYTALNDLLAQRSEALVDIAEDGNVLALNAVLASRRLGSDGGPLTAIAETMQETFPHVIRSAKLVVDQIHTTRSALEQVGFAVALAVLQHEIVDTYRTEIRRDHTTTTTTAPTDMQLLLGCLDNDIASLTNTLTTVATGLTETTRLATGLDTELRLLAAIERNGRIESARAADAHAFTSLLASIRDRVTSAQTETRQLATLAAHADLRNEVGVLQTDRADIRRGSH